MGAVWNNENKRETLDAILASTPVVNGKLLLFTVLAAINDATPYATFAANEAAFTGYARQAVSGWSAASLSSHRAVSVSEIITFLNTGGSPSATITGWAFVDDTNSKVIIADLYSTPFAIAAGSNYTTALVLTYRGEFNANP